MDRVAVFVDAGYLYAGGATSVSGSSKKRTEISLDIPAVVQYLIAREEAITQQKILRIYWYDGAISNRLSTDHQLLASSDNVKLRLGIINGFGEQKGVDAKIIMDLADLARNGALVDAVLVGGDEDLRIGVELAQERGARVHLVTIEGSSSSPTLRQESDTVTTLARADIQTFLTILTPQTATPAPAASAVPSSSTPVTSPSSAIPSTAVPIASPSSLAVPTPAPTVAQPPSQAVIAIFETEVKTYVGSLAAAEQVALTSAIKSSNTIPTEHDGRVLGRTRTALGRPLDWAEKNALRKILRKELGL